MDEDGHLLLILHQVPQASDDEVRTAVLFWRQPEGTWKSAPQAGGLSALEEHLKIYREKIHALDHDVESAANPTDYFEVMQEVQPVLRSTRHLLDVLQGARQARKEEAALIGLRDMAAVLERAIELAAGDAKAGMDFSLAKSAQEQSQAAHRSNLEARRLNRLVAFFFPLATLVSFFSMDNAGRVLASGSSWVVVLAGVLFGALVLFVITRGRSE